MLQNLTKGKMVEWVVLLVALVALGLSIAAVAKPCSSNFADKIKINGKILPGTAEGKACRNDMACRGGPSYVCPPGTACVPREGRISNCVKGEKEKTFICDDGGGNVGSTDICCSGIGKRDCDTGYHCATAPPGSYCTQMGRSQYVCKQGDPTACIQSGDSCENNPTGCCPGLTCFVGTCVRQSDVHKESEALKTHCTNNEDCAEVGGGVCLPDNKCSTFHQGQTGYIPGIHSGGKDAKSGGKNGLIGGGGLSRLDNIGGGAGLPSPSPSHSPSPSPSPSPGGDGKKSSDLPLILGLSGGGLVIVLAIAYLIVTKRLKL
jgi:hypothetical protein